MGFALWWLFQGAGPRSTVLCAWLDYAKNEFIWVLLHCKPARSRAAVCPSHIPQIMAFHALPREPPAILVQGTQEIQPISIERIWNSQHPAIVIPIVFGIAIGPISIPRTQTTSPGLSAPFRTIAYGNSLAWPLPCRHPSRRRSGAIGVERPAVLDLGRSLTLTLSSICEGRRPLDADPSGVPGQRCIAIGAHLEYKHGVRTSG
ncbi:hypothetical protein OF83DRAFT_1081405 [Amylostereum chailletii]|nr:hypothetical protein OF83DRAFT_1081405 [Amylostereum chailletii]